MVSSSFTPHGLFTTHTHTHTHTWLAFSSSAKCAPGDRFNQKGMDKMPRILLNVSLRCIRYLSRCTCEERWCNLWQSQGNGSALATREGRVLLWANLKGPLCEALCLCVADIVRLPDIFHFSWEAKVTRSVCWGSLAVWELLRGLLHL